jgi:hypothetical protein
MLMPKLKNSITNTIIGNKAWIFFVLLTISLLFWAFAVQMIDVEDISPMGLITALPFPFFASFVVLTVSFFLLVYQEREQTGLLFIHIFVLILIIHGTLAIVYDSPRYSWTYRVIGMVAHVQQYGIVDPGFGPYYSWPGFFVVFGYISAFLGVETPMAYAGWAQFVFNSMYLFALLFIFRNLTANWRRIWIAIWLFYLTSWIGQDLFAPQAFNYFLYLIFFGITIKWFLKENEINLKSKIGKLIGINPLPLKHDHIKKEESAEAKTIGPLIILILIYGLIVSSHQLTPFMIIAGVLFLSLFVGHKSKTLSITLAVILGSWIIFIAWGYVSLNAHLFQKVFSLYNNIIDSLFIRYNFKDVPTKHLSMLYSGYFQTGIIWLLAIIGGFKRKNISYPDKIATTLALSPFVLLLLFTYGGEVLFRIHFFSLPWIAYLAAAIFTQDNSTKFHRFGKVFLYASLSVILLFGLLLSFFGNEFINHIPKDEIEVINYFYDEAIPGSLLYTPLFLNPTNFSADFQLFEHHSILTTKEFHTEEFSVEEINAILDFMANEKYPESYFLMTEGQLKYNELYIVTPDGAMIRLLEALLATEQVEIVKANSNAILLKYIGERQD